MGKQGQGSSTARKQEGFYALFRAILRVHKNRTFPFWHIDLNAGSGFNEIADCDGSPLTFLKAAIEVGMSGPVHAYFCDIEPDRIEQLRANCYGLVERLPDGSTVGATAMDNGDFLDMVEERIGEVEAQPELASGIVVCDPNGFPDGCPVPALAGFFQKFCRLDFVLNLNISLFARVRGCLSSEDEAIRKGFLSWPELRELLPRFGKAHWFIRNPSRGPRERFVTFWGHNSDGFGKRKFLDFFPLDSPQGQEIITTLGRVNPDQGYLFEGME